jgi:hypothetical protein
LVLLGSVTLPKKAKGAEKEPDAEEPKFELLAAPLHQVAGPLLIMCVAGYWSALEPDLERHFQDETVLLFVAFAWLYTNLMKRDPKLKSTLVS